MTRLRAALTALALVAAVLLGGCSQSPDTAAVVNGVVIRESTVQSEAAAMPPITGSDGIPFTPQQIRTLVLRYSVFGEIARQVATRQNLNLGTLNTTTADAESAALLATPAGNSLLQNAYAWTTLRDQLSKTDTSTNVTDASALQAALMAESVVLNPRYGTWDVSAAVTSNAVSATTGSMSDLTTKK